MDRVRARLAILRPAVEAFGTLALPSRLAYLVGLREVRPLLGHEQPLPYDDGPVRARGKLSNTPGYEITLPLFGYK